MPGEKPFSFSEQYVFGKFEAFCCRLNNITGLFDDIDKFSGFFEGRAECETNHFTVLLVPFWILITFWNRWELRDYYWHDLLIFLKGGEIVKKKICTISDNFLMELCRYVYKSSCKRWSPDIVNDQVILPWCNFRICILQTNPHDSFVP